MLTSVVLCPPTYMDGAIPNNVYMKNLINTKGSIQVDTKRAIEQYNCIKKVYKDNNIKVLEIPPTKGCQDQVYTANIGVYLGNNRVLLSNFIAEGRKEEEVPGFVFFLQEKFDVAQAPQYFEGEADFKHLRDNIYFGAYGIRTSKYCLEWIQRNYNINIVPIHMTNEYLYHLDCVVFPIDKENMIVTREGTDEASIKEMEKYANLIFTPPKFSTAGITNSVKIENKKLLITHFSPDLHSEELDWVKKAFSKFGYTTQTLTVDEFEKSGALLSCCVMHIRD